MLVDAAALRAEVDSVVSAVEARRRECEDAALALEKAEQLAATMQAEVQCVITHTHTHTHTHIVL